MLKRTLMSTSKGAALITGGAHRIGAAIALALSKQGLDIALHYLSSHDAAAAVAHEIEGMGRQCHLLRCDLNAAILVNSKSPFLDSV